VGISVIIRHQENIMDLKIAKRKYNVHKGGAKSRDIPFLFTFEEWCNIWEQSGKWEQRGTKKGQYSMSRYGDKGPYAIDNVHVQLTTANTKEAAIGHTRWLNKKHKETTRSIMSTNMLNQPTLTCPHCNKIGKGRIMLRWHMDNCKTINIK
jgi:hypothetical protein